MYSIIFVVYVIISNSILFYFTMFSCIILWYVCYVMLCYANFYCIWICCIFSNIIFYYTILHCNILHYLIWYESYYVDHFVELSKVASSIILPAKTTHMSLLRTRHKDLVFANSGGCEPPAFSLSRAGELSRTSHHEHGLHQTQNCFRAFQNSS